MRSLLEKSFKVPNSLGQVIPQTSPAIAKALFQVILVFGLGKESFPSRLLKL